MKVLSKRLLKDIETEVMASFDFSEIIKTQWVSFWQQILVNNSYNEVSEEKFKPRKLKPYYKAVYIKIMLKHLTKETT